MVRHNGTFAHLTSYNLGLIMTRHRATQTLGISDFVEYSDAPILRATALTVYAYNDAVERYDEHVARGQPLWIKDPYRGETKAAQAAEKEAAKRKARNVAAPSSSEDEDNDDDDDSEDDHDNDDGGNDSNGDDDDGPSGGNGGARGGAGGGGGGDYPGSGSAPSRGGPGGNDGSGSEAKGSAAREARATKWAGRTRGASYLDLGVSLRHTSVDLSPSLILQCVHLAFKVPKKHLTPVQDDSSVHFPEGLGLGAALQEYPLDQRRRLSAGSARSSASSASTRTSVPSLFSEQASSTPTSPSTTASFAHASRDSSPFPEKANHHADPHPSISATVCDAAGILIDDVLGESAIGTVWSGKMILEDDSDDDSSIAIAVKMAVPRNNGDEEENGSRRALFAKAIEMHSVGICHNDLVPRNIIQDSEGELTILIVDFHIADLDHRCPGKDKCRELLKFRAALNL
ncbi:hypothetical protein C8F04DRAFT_1120843 [Mycena alexandri]|uniref:Protein kinase domain-containing protein n=1 Tax=Mycena alexandri TaxID=1745969 RepID=A0AAD6SKL9_9AGAR|nr:hypothetical protein C8F04DRAFT_1120843 [Mycena alexandri]